MKRLISLILAVLLCMPGALADREAQLQDMLHKGAQFVAQGDYASAEICYDIAAQLSPQDERVYAALSDLHAAKGDDNQALAYIEDALAIAPAEGALYLKKAEILFRQGEDVAAMTAIRYAEICGAAPHGTLCVALAAVYAQRGDYETALHWFDSAPQELWREAHGATYDKIKNAMTAAKKTDANITLWQAVENGMQIALTPVALDITEMPLFYPASAKEAMEQEAVSGALTKDKLRVKVEGESVNSESKTPRLICVSPSGNIRLYNADRMLVMVQNGEATVMAPSSNRGAQNEYTQNTMKYWPILGNRAEDSQIVWSPDERYFALTFPQAVLQELRMFDLIIADTLSGELFLAEATPDRMFKNPDAVGALDACFDPSGRYVYYTCSQRDSVEQKMGTLKRYTIKDDKVEVLCKLDEMPGGYGMSMDQDGRLRCYAWQNGRELGEMILKVQNGKWSSTFRVFEQDYLKGLQCGEYSGESGMKLQVTAFTYSDGISGHSTVLQGLHAGMDEQRETVENKVLMLPETGGVAEYVDAKEGYALPFAPNNAYLKPINAVLSPDGCFALVIAWSNGQLGAYLLNLFTLHFVPLTLPDDVELYPLVSRYNDILAWPAADRVVLLTQDGGLECRVNIGDHL